MKAWLAALLAAGLVLAAVLWPRRAGAVGSFLTEDALRAAMPRISAQRLSERPLLAAAMSEFGITTRQRGALFLGQLAHESDDLRYFGELWGPTAAQLRYERPAGAPLDKGPRSGWPLWQKLGNTEPGDGYRYRGRGPIQLTGRSNYELASNALGLDLVDDPDLASTPEVGYRIAAWFWKANGLNELADAGDVVAITRKVNGGTNGLPDRQTRTARALAALDVPEDGIAGLA